MSQTREVLSEQIGCVRWIFLNRPAFRNAIDGAVVESLGQMLSEFAEDDSVEVVVIAGNGPTFCAGADLNHLLELARTPEGPMPFLAQIGTVVSTLEAFSKPVVAAVHGHVVAGGLELALACDVVVAAEGTMIGDGHLRNRLLPAAGSSVRLPPKVGPALARWLLLSGELLPAERVAQSGWLHSVVPHGELRGTASALASRLGEFAGPAQRNMKRLLTEIDAMPHADALRAEHDAFEANWATADVPGALAAFLGSPRQPARASGYDTI
jgi:enoyl-CoA hydratase/carnithine racemase